jgi:aryl-alcohol dehydrogenase-like predicted oxidoreductase
MNLKQLGNSDLQITPVGLGTWAIGGEGAMGWGPQDDAESIATIRNAVESGINWIDTAAIYGFGHSEKIVAQALKDIGNNNRPYIFTKCSLVWDENLNFSHNMKAESIRKEVEESLKRLDIDVIDLYQIHWPTWPPGSPDPDIEEAWTELTKLKQQGKVRAIGVSNFNVQQLERAQIIEQVTSLQPPYSMLMRDIETDILPYCEQNNIGVIAYSPLHNGLLTGKMTRERIEALHKTDWRKHINPAFKEPHLTKNLELVELLKDIGARHERTAGEVAIAWTLRLSSVTGAIVGARRPDQIDGISGALDFRLSNEEIAEIEAKLPESINMFQLA